MSERIRKIVAKDRIAVITGAAKDIDGALAREFATRSMCLALLNQDEDALAPILPVEVLTVMGSVTEEYLGGTVTVAEYDELDLDLAWRYRWQMGHNRLNHSQCHLIPQYSR